MTNCSSCSVEVIDGINGRVSTVFWATEPLAICYGCENVKMDDDSDILRYEPIAHRDDEGVL